MGRQCTVCGHKDVEEINKLLLSGTSFRDIAGQFDLSKTALARHKESHIPKELLKSNDIQEIANRCSFGATWRSPGKDSIAS